VSAAREPIAIVGIACRFPGAPSPEEFWEMLRDGRDGISEVPADRWDAAELYDADPAAPGKMTTRFGGFLPRVDEFDAHFFRISPREAERIDPQQRLLLELAWEALEDGGQAADQLRGTETGVFVGISSFDYGALQLRERSLTDPHLGTGVALSVAANRISYALDLRGPSVAVDTACSSSLVAIHLASQALRSRDCALALAGGVTTIAGKVTNAAVAEALGLPRAELSAALG
jgi:myxalamid-type polyketide synthase MxaE and MxaD